MGDKIIVKLRGDSPSGGPDWKGSVAVAHAGTAVGGGDRSAENDDGHPKVAVALVPGSAPLAALQSCTRIRYFEADQNSSGCAISTVPVILPSLDTPDAR